MTVRRHNAHGCHHAAGLQHHLGPRRLDGPGQQRQSLLVIKQVAESNLVVHDRLQTLDALQLDFIPLGVTEIEH